MCIHEIHISEPGFLIAFARNQLEIACQQIQHGAVRLKIPRLGAEQQRVEHGHFHLFPEVFLQVSGTTRFRCIQQQFALLPGEICVMPGGIAHAEQADDSETPFYHLVFECLSHDSFSCHLGGKTRLQRPQVLIAEHYHGIDARRYIQLLDDVIAAYWQSTPYHINIIQGSLFTLFNHFLTVLNDQEPKKFSESQKISRCKKIIVSHLDRSDLTVRSLADLLQCSADYLSFLFKQETGENIIAYIRRKRFEKARELLKTSNLNISEVAWACGYSDPGYFTRLFRKAFALTPKQYRCG